MKTILAFLAVGVALGLQFEDPSKIKRLQPLVGEWNVAVHVLGPDGMSIDLKGTMSAKWTMDNSYVQLQTRFVHPDSKEKKPFESVGYVTYDENAMYDRRCYRGYFLWQGDGRALPLQGDFVGGKLVMKGTPLALSGDRVFEVRTTATFKDKNTILIDIEALDKSYPGAAPLGTISLKRKVAK